MILPLNSSTESKHKYRNDNKTKTSCKVMTLDEQIQILDKLRGGISAAAVGPTFR
jgi:phage gp16-like protein